MPSKNVKQREALIAKKGIEWVRAHGFDRIEGQAPKTAAQRKHKKR